MRDGLRREDQESTLSRSADNDDVDGTKEVLELIFLVGTPIVSSQGRLLSETEYQYKRVCRLLDQQHPWERCCAKTRFGNSKKQKDLSIIVKNRYVVVDSIDLHRRLRTSSLQGFISVSLSLKQIIKNQTVNSTGYSSVGRAADCRSAGHLFESGCPDLISRMQVLCKLVKFFK